MLWGYGKLKYSWALIKRGIGTLSSIFPRSDTFRYFVYIPTLSSLSQSEQLSIFWPLKTSHLQLRHP